jgi:drug/metabolite transporter (DMT)-like permease
MVLQTLISAATFLVAKRSLQEIHPLAVLAGRFALSGILFWVILLTVPGPVVPPRRAWKRTLVLGLLAGPLNQGLFLWGLSRSTPAHAALFYALTPTAVYLYALWRGQELASPGKVAGIVIAFSGVLVLLLGRGLRAAMGPLVGDLFILCGVAAWAVYTAEGKAFTAEHGAVRATAWSLIAASIWILPTAPFALAPSRFANASAMALAGIVYMAIFTSVVSYSLWYFALSRLDASRVAVFSNLQPVVAALAAYWLLGEPLNWEMAAGGLLVLLGVRVTQTKG